ncbi:MAG: hypothetical protein RLZZ299_1256 [Pseudomonadota bacterium]
MRVDPEGCGAAPREDAFAVIRITGGTHRGRGLPAPVPASARPTSGRVREALFSIVGQDLSGWSMLDACGGSGLVALEAASRGASPVTVYERDGAAAAAVRRNAETLGLPVTVRAADSLRSVLPEADFVFLDPPYRDDIAAWLRHVAPSARRVLVAEARAGASWPDLAGFERERERAYGDTVLAVYVRRDGGDGAP